MCTVTWVRESEEGYTLCVNRDEKRSRMAAAAPGLHRAAGVWFLAPVDGERGGSWVAANEAGVSVCLVNRYDEAVKNQWEGAPSRGALVLWLAPSSGCEDAARRLRAMDLSRYPPFTVVCLEPARPALALDWTGRALRGDFEAEERRPLVSSSKLQDEASRARRELFARFRGDGLTKEALLDFHASHEPEPGALSPCMHREDAATVSFTMVEVSRSKVSMSYRDGAPCGHGAASVRSLPRRVRRDVRAA